MRRLLGLTLAAALVATTLLALPAGQAFANHVKCGDSIYQDTKLDSDLIDCVGGLSIGADNVTLDLNGHTIDGSGAGVFAAGIVNGSDPNSGLNFPGHAGVTIENGVIQDFLTGVELGQAKNNTVRELTVSSNFAGMLLEASNDNQIEKNTVSNNDVGIGLFEGSHFNRIEKNSVTDNLCEWVLCPDIGPGAIELYNSCCNEITRNAVSSGNFNGILVHSSGGVVVERNLVSDNGRDGIFVFSGIGQRVFIERNVANRNGDDGIDSVGLPNTLTANTANDNGDLGIEGGYGDTDGGGNKAKGNGNPLQCLTVVCK